MTFPTKIDLAKATRLTRAGRLKEAVAVLTGGALEPQKAADSPPRRLRPDQGATPSEIKDGRMFGLPKVGRATLSPHPLPPLGTMGFDPVKPFGAAGAFAGLPGIKPTTVTAPLPPGAQFEEHVFANEAGSRSYKLYVPSGRAGQALPLVIMLHGCTQSPDDFAAGTRMNELAEEEGFLVAYPAQTQAANTSKCWNWFRSADQARDGGEPSLIAGITRAIVGAWSVDPRRVYVAGLSAGGAAAAIMGQTYPDLYAAIGVHSGLACGAARDMTSAFAAMRQGSMATPGSFRPGDSAAIIPTIVFHGDGDHTVSPVNGDQVIAQSKATARLEIEEVRGEAAGGQRYTRTIQRDQAAQPILEHWILHGAGHAWSGGSAMGSYTDPRGPDASREMMRFFHHHALPTQG